MRSGVPRLSRALLALALRPGDRRYALADLEEELEMRAARQGRAAARRWYRGQVLRSCIPALLGRLSPARSPAPRSRASKRRSSADVIRDRFGDLRYAWRSLARSPLSTAITVLSLGLGTGAVTATFSLLSGVLFPPPVGIAEPERLVALYTSEPGGRRYGSSSFPDYLDMRAGLAALRDAAAVSVRSVGFTAAGRTRPLLAEEVTGNYFAVTGIRPVLGRGFIETEAAPGGAAAPVAVVAYELWQRELGADPGVIGRTLRLDGRVHTVIGVMPAGVVSRRVPLPPDLWLPLGGLDGERSAAERRFEDRRAAGFLVLGRLSAGVDFEALQAQAAVLSARLRVDHAEAWVSERGEQRSLVAAREADSRLNPETRRLLAAVGAFFLGAAGLVLLAACSNAASLLVARVSRRAREIAVRVALGASRRRLLGLFAAEGLLLGVASTGLALVVALWVGRAIGAASLGLPIPIRLGIGNGLHVVAFALAVALGASLLPAVFAARGDLMLALRGGALAVGRRDGRLAARNLLVIVQCAASLVLLVGATLFVRSLQHATGLDLGMRPEGIAVASWTPDPGRFDPETGAARLRALRDTLAAHPEVERVAMSRGVELTLFQPTRPVEVAAVGAETATADSECCYRNSVSPGYLELLDVPLLAGRTLRESDVRSAPLVAVVNQTFAGRFWPGENPLGRQFWMSDPQAPGEPGARRALTVVGLARDGKYQDFDDPATPYFWTSLDQDPAPTVIVLARSRDGAAGALQRLADEVRPGADELQQVPPSLLESHVAFQFTHLRLASQVLGWGGGFALLLALVGVYGIVSLAVAQRTKEMAIRIAVGASRFQVIRSVLWDGVGLAAAGVLSGIAVAAPAAHSIQGVLAGVGAFDPLAFGGGALVLLLAAAAASAIPARRLTRIDPLSALRRE